MGKCDVVNTCRVTRWVSPCQRIMYCHWILKVRTLTRLPLSLVPVALKYLSSRVLAPSLSPLGPVHTCQQQNA